MVASHHTRPSRPRPIAQRVLPGSFSLPPPPQPRQPTTADTADWFPPLLPNASDLANHRCGAHQMLTLVAYDITDPKRLHRVAKVCEDWGMHIQYSLFECRLEANAFDRFWAELCAVIDPKTDKLTAFKICAKCSREIRSQGIQEHYEKVVAYVC